MKALQITQILDKKQSIKEEIKNFYNKLNKPILFGELGFPITVITLFLHIRY